MNATARVSFLLALSATASSSAFAQSCAGSPNQLGTVTVVANNCAGGAGSLPGTTCQRLRVDCASLPTIFARLRVTEPPPAVPLRGTVLFGVGGGGVGFYGDRVGGEPLLLLLLERGFRIVDRSWESSWFGDPVGVRNQSCRYATLLTWVHDNLHTTGAFCVSGNSGGSAEIGYALSTWNRGQIVDVAVPTGGPPMSRLDLLCGTSATWPQQCATVVPANVMECQPACQVQPGHPVCNSCTSGATAAQLRTDSILHIGAAVDYPTTRVHIVLGAMDCTSAVPAALLFHGAITSEKVVEFVPGTPHWTATTAAGRQAIVRALLGGASCGSHPSTLAWQALPAPGTNLDLDVQGPAGGFYVLGNGPATSLLELAPFGWLFLHTPVIAFASGALDPVTGRATHTIAVPSNPSLVGLITWFQALAGTCLSNVLRVEII